MLDFDAAWDLRANALAPLCAWAPALQERGFFEPGGRGPDGFDCWGLGHWVLGLIGLAAPTYEGHYRGLDVARTGDVDALIRAEAKAWRRGRGEIGDLLVCGSQGRAHHVAVLCGAGRAIHALPKAGVKIEEIHGRRRVTHFAGYRVFGVLAPS